MSGVNQIHEPFYNVYTERLVSGKCSAFYIDWLIVEHQVVSILGVGYNGYGV
jgi:hypothetical protein